MKLLLVLLISTLTALAQPLELKITEVNTSGLPRISFRTHLLENGATRSQANGVQLDVRENGVPVDFDISCPGPYNSIMLVVHPGCQWFFPWNTTSVDSLTLALRVFIEQLGPDDEVQIVLSDTSSAGEFIQTDFTTDKEYLKSFVAGITPIDRYNYNTPSNKGEKLIDAASTSVNELASRSGYKYCIIFTAGVWQTWWWKGHPESTSQSTLEAVNIAESFVLYCKNNGIPVHALSWMTSGQFYEYDVRMNRITRETGGDFYHFHKPDNDTLSKTTASIAARLQQPFCTISYDATGCMDSLREIELSAETNGNIAFADTIVKSPWRLDSLTFVVDADILDAVPPDEFRVSFRIEPRLDTALLTTFSFLIQYDPEEFRWHPPLETGDMMINTPLLPLLIRPGVVRCQGAYVLPSNNTGNFAIGTFEALTTAGSRPAIITIDSVTLTNGCPNTVIVHPDTVYICRCKYGLPFEAQATTLVTGDYVTVPVMIPDTLLFGREPVSGNALFSMNIAFDSSSLAPISVDGVGTVSENALLKWRIKNGDTLEVYTTERFATIPGQVLYNVRFRVKQQKAPVYASIGVPSMRLFTDCCFTQSDSLPNTILIDGLCDKIVRRRADFTLEPNSPNPARGETSFRFTVHEQERFSESQAILTLYRSDGTVVSELYNNSVRPGEYAVPYNLATLPAGTYYYTLSISGRVQTRSMVVVR